MSYMVFPILLIIYEFVVNMSNDMYMPFFPLIANEFRVSDPVVSLTLSAWLFGGAVAQIVIGPLSDRYGHKQMLISGGVLFILSCVICIFSTHIDYMIAGRFLQGVSVCSMMIAGYACIHETYKDQQAITILTIMSSVSIIAPMIGPVIGGYLALFYNWRVVFWILCIGAALSIISLYFYMPSKSYDVKKSISLYSIAIGYKVLLTNCSFIFHSLCFGMGYTAIMLWVSVSPFLLMNIYGLDTYTFGLYQVPIFLSYVIGTMTTSYLIKKIELVKIMRAGFIISIIGVISVSISCTLHLLYPIMQSISICMIAIGMLAAPLNRLSFNASNGDKGITASVFYTCMMGTGAIVIKLFSYTEYSMINFAIVFCIILFIQMIVYTISQHYFSSLES